LRAAGRIGQGRRLHEAVTGSGALTSAPHAMCASDFIIAQAKLGKTMFGRLDDSTFHGIILVLLLISELGR
jgi:hypothetical protein